jgi:hypothetical protein
MLVLLVKVDGNLQVLRRFISSSLSSSTTAGVNCQREDE